METLKRWSYYKRSRGRPDRRTTLYVRVLESIILIAGRYDLDPKLLFDAFIEAWRGETSQIGDLKITYRCLKNDSATFIITAGEKVISQFPINQEVLKYPGNLKNQIQYFPISPHVQRKLEGKPKKIDQLSYGMKRFNVKVKILEIPQTVRVYTRFGNIVTVSNVKVADETGSIRLTLWNKQITTIKVGDTVELTNCWISKYNGELRLRIGRKGKLTIINDKEVL